MSTLPAASWASSWRGNAKPVFSVRSGEAGGDGSFGFPHFVVAAAIGAVVGALVVGAILILGRGSHHPVIRLLEAGTSGTR